MIPGGFKRERMPSTIAPIPAHQFPSQAFPRKWSLTGKTAVSPTTVSVTVNWPNGARPGMTTLAVQHEDGHALDLESIPHTMIGARDSTAKWIGELNAWAIARANVRNDPPMSYEEGTFVLDALNSYRRGLSVSEDDWMRARAMVESWNAEPERLREYVPLEPDPGEEPTDCFGEPMPMPNGNEDNEDDNEDGNEDGNGYRDGEGYWHDAPDTPDAHEIFARDRWLHSDEGVRVTREGTGALMGEMESRGWVSGNLPPLTRALLGKGE